MPSNATKSSTVVRSQAKVARKAQPKAAGSRREAALRRIANIIEGQMTADGLSEEEKNARVDLFASLVDREVSEKTKLDAKPSVHPQTAANPV